MKAQQQQSILFPAFSEKQAKRKTLTERSQRVRGDPAKKSWGWQTWALHTASSSPGVWPLLHRAALSVPAGKMAPKLANHHHHLESFQHVESGFVRLGWGIEICTFKKLLVMVMIPQKGGRKGKKIELHRSNISIYLDLYLELSLYKSEADSVELRCLCQAQNNHQNNN